MQRETNALHAELLAKAASRNDEDAAEREAHAETRRKLVKAKGLLGKHGVTWDESDDVIGDLLRYKIGSGSSRRNYRQMKIDWSGPRNYRGSDGVKWTACRLL